MITPNKPRVPKGLAPWPNQTTPSGKFKPLTRKQLIHNYATGKAAVQYDPEEREALFSAMPNADGEQLAYDNKFVDGRKDKLTCLWLPIEKHYGTVWPKPGQETGDCTSRAGANIGTILLGIDASSHLLDEITSILEGFPTLSDTAIREGIVAPEPIYGDRGHAGQGASCSRLIRHVMDWGGIILRKKYTKAKHGFTVNLEELETKLGISWGRSNTPEALRSIGKDHQIRNATNVSKWQVAGDFVTAGHPLWACSGLGWDNQRDNRGYSRQKGSWSHSWVVDGWDARPETIKEYGFELAHYNHDWGRWNKGGRIVFGTSIQIPEGSFWFDARLLNKCDLSAMNSLDGWEAKQLPEMDLSYL